MSDLQEVDVAPFCQPVGPTVDLPPGTSILNILKMFFYDDSGGIHCGANQ